MTREFTRGWYAAMDRIANMLNALDTEGMSAEDVRSRVAHEVLTLAKETQHD